MRCVALFLATLLFATMPAEWAAAQGTDEVGDGGFDVVRAVDEVPGSDAGGGGGASDGPVCSTRPSSMSRTGTVVQGDYRINYIDGTAYRISLTTNQVWARMYRSCTYPDGRVVSGNIWVLVSDPDPVVFIDGTVDDVTRNVYAPRPALSPVTRGVVNLGMWLAVQPQVPVTAFASASPTTWAQTTATMRETTFDFGNGDSITCAGGGDPIPASAKDSIEQSPICGYTYRDTNGGEPYRLTITSTWSVVSTTSSGVVVNQPDIVLSTTIDYPVVEIQTVGASG